MGRRTRARLRLRRGRTLRHFEVEAQAADAFLGCDIDAESIQWAQDNLCPPFEVFCNEAEPPLPLDASSLDLVYAFSVFTHLADTWAQWLLELHRVLRPGGTLIATFLGPGGHAQLGRPWDEDRIGMLVTIPNETFVDSSGPVIYHSEWWLREYWGRVFDIVEYRPWAYTDDGPAAGPFGHGCVALRKRDVTVTLAELERHSADPREWTAMHENLAVLHEREAAWRARATAAEAELEAIRSSRSWRAAQAVAKVARPVRRTRT